MSKLEKLKLQVTHLLDESNLKNDMVVGVPIIKIVDLDEWQKIRVTLIGNWKLKPNQNLNKLKSFLGPVKTASRRKLRIVQNYLSGSGFRLGKIKSSGITAMQVQIRNEINRRRERKDWR